MDASAYREKLLTPQEITAQQTLSQAKAAGYSLHQVLKGTLLDDFLNKEITKFSVCNQQQLPQKRYDFNLGEDFSYRLEIMDLDRHAAKPIKHQQWEGHWELVQLNKENVILKLKQNHGNSDLTEPRFIRISHQEIDWIDNF